MTAPIVVPSSLLPRPDRDCACMKIPVDLTAKKGVLTWLVEVGEPVRQGQVVCEGEVDKKTVEIEAPCGGILLEKQIEDEYVFGAGDILGVIEQEG